MLAFNQQSAETQVLGDGLQAVGIFARLLRYAGGPPNQMGFLVVGPHRTAWVEFQHQHLIAAAGDPHRRGGVATDRFVGDLDVIGALTPNLDALATGDVLGVANGVNAHHLFAVGNSALAEDLQAGGAVVGWVLLLGFKHKALSQRSTGAQQGGQCSQVPDGANHR